MKNIVASGPKGLPGLPGFRAEDFGSGAFHSILDAIPDLAVILDAQRRAVFVNKAMLAWLGKGSMRGLTGQRTGDLLACIHRKDQPEGCGEGEACQFCGANLAINSALRTGKPATGECRISVQRADHTVSLDLRIGAYPFTHRRSTFIVVTINDISDQKRRQALERIFFHDVINTAGGLKGLLEMMGQVEDPDELRTLARDVSTISGRLLDEIRAQKTLSQAESGELVPRPERHILSKLLNEAMDLTAHHPVAEKHRIRLSCDTPPNGLIVETDRSLFIRVLVNMLKNAVEASADNATVHLSCQVPPECPKGRFQVRVHNAGVMTREVQMQLFQRSFSTKGSNRGLGTYSMKLLTERYLKGRIFYESTAERGTIFTLELPLV